MPQERLSGPRGGELVTMIKITSWRERLGMPRPWLSQPYASSLGSGRIFPAGRKRHAIDVLLPEEIAKAWYLVNHLSGKSTRYR